MAWLTNSVGDIWQMSARFDGRQGVWSVVWLLAGVLTFVYAALGAVLFLFQSRLIYFPERQLSATPQDAGLPFQDVFLTTDDDVRIHGWFIPARQARAAVLFCHGNAGNISNRLYTIGLFNRLGLHTMIFDYRGYGNSAGRPGEKGTYLDAEAAWKHLTQARQIPAEKIVVFGRSLGGPIAARIARDNRPAALIIESAFTSMPDLAARIYPIFPVRLFCRFGYDTVKYVQHVRCPVLVVHSPDDEIIPYSHGRRVFEAANEPKEFLEITGGHNEGFIDCSRLHQRTLDRFICEHLAKGPNS